MKQFQIQLMPPFFRGENPIGKFLEILQEKQEEELTEKIISILEAKGYKVTPPPREVKDEYTFDRAWNGFKGDSHRASFKVILRRRKQTDI